LTEGFEAKLQAARSALAPLLMDGSTISLDCPRVAGPPAHAVAS